MNDPAAGPGRDQHEAAADRRPREPWWRLPHLLFQRYSLPLFVAAALGLLVYLAVSEDGFIKNRGLKAERERLLVEIETLKDENQVLAERLERLKNDPAYVEDQARSKLGLVRPGETVYRLSEEPDLALPESALEAGE